MAKEGKGICPLLAMAIASPRPSRGVGLLTEGPPPKRDCLREDCQWWLSAEKDKRCAVKAIATRLRSIDDLITRREKEN